MVDENRGGEQETAKKMYCCSSSYTIYNIGQK